MDRKQQLAAYLKEIRFWSRLSRKDMAKLLKISESRLTKLEQAKESMSLDVLRRLAALIGVTDWEVLQGIGIIEKCQKIIKR